MVDFKKIGLVFLVVILLFLGACSTQTELVYGSEELQTYDISLPSGLQENEVRPVILYIHGGGWIAGDKDNFTYMEDATNDAGYIYVSMNYRLASDGITYINMLEDIHLMIQFLKDHAEEYHIDISGIALVGSSAGGHLALLYSYKETESPIPVAFVVSMVGPADLTDPGVLDDSIDPSVVNMVSAMLGEPYDTSTFETEVFDDKVIDASPIFHVDSNSVPTLMAYGMLDNLIPYSNPARLDAKLTEEGVTHDFITFANSGHGLESDLDEESRTAFYQTFRDYLNLYLPIIN